jgi:hypothetical protein
LVVPLRAVGRAGPEDDVGVPGGAVFGAPGHNCACEALADLEAKKVAASPTS